MADVKLIDDMWLKMKEVERLMDGEKTWSVILKGIMSGSNLDESKLRTPIMA